jgi:hypothetical protein
MSTTLDLRYYYCKMRKVNVDELVGTAEIADRLEVAGPAVVHDWRRRHPDFPAPIALVSSVYVWAWPDVKRWARRTSRLPVQ